MVVSAGVNLLLAPACWLKYRHNADTPGAPAQTATAAPMQVRVIEKTKTNVVAAVVPAKMPDWRAVESEDYKRYIANLQAIGCPEKTIRDIIIADINELYRQRFLAEFPMTNRIEYWVGGDPLANLIDETHVARLQEFAKEKREVIKDLLGRDYSADVELSSIQTDIFMEQLLNFLSPEKRTAMKELEHTYRAKMMKTFKDSVRGDNQAANVVMAEKDADTLKILSPEEKFEYELRRSEPAMMARVALGDFEVTEQEFRGIFPALKKFIVDGGLFGFRTVVAGQPDERAEAAAARKELENGLKATLGEKRLQQLLEQTGWNLQAE